MGAPDTPKMEDTDKNEQQSGQQQTNTDPNFNAAEQGSSAGGAAQQEEQRDDREAEMAVPIGLLGHMVDVAERLKAKVKTAVDDGVTATEMAEANALHSIMESAHQQLRGVMGTLHNYAHLLDEDFRRTVEAIERML